MKRIAFTLAALALSAGAAFAAAPTTPGSAPATTQAPNTTTLHRTHPATAMRNDVDAPRMTKALNILEAKGYASFNNFKADGANYSATVTQNGHEQTVVVNPDNGQVTTQS